MEVSWEETRDILKQLEGVFQSEDSDMVDAMARTSSEIVTMLEQGKQDIKASIRELARQVHGEDSAEGQRDRVDDGLKSATAVHSATMAALRREQAEVAHTMQQLKQEEQALAAEVAAVSAAEKRTEVEASRVQATKAADIPRVKHSMSLYANISNIRWDQDSRNVAGCVVPPDGGAMKPFSMPETASPYQVANALWDLIAAATPE